LIESYHQNDYIIGSTKKGFNNKKRPFGDWYDKVSNGTSNSPCKECELLPVCGGAALKVGWRIFLIVRVLNLT
jgi:radical SAM protein with 4Fe4S-binding SPASM domain